MNTKLEIDSDLGIVGLWDVTTPPIVNEKPGPQLEESLRGQAKTGKLFFIAADDPVKYRIHVLIGEDPADSLPKHFENVAGSFRLELPSGELAVLGITSKPAPSQTQLRTSPGTYLLTVLRRRHFDSTVYNQTMEQLVGVADWRYHKRITNLGALGCLTLGLAIILLLIPITRKYWYIIIPASFLPTVAYRLMLLLPRCKRVESVCKTQERELPHFIIQLKPSALPEDVRGGWLSDGGRD